MTEHEAKLEAYKIWVKWENHNKTGNMVGLKFYTFLENEYPNVLNFLYSSDRYQLVAAWVNEWQRHDKVRDRV